MTHDRSHAFGGHGLNRAGVERADPAWVDAQRDSRSARFMLLRRACPLVAGEDGAAKLVLVGEKDLALFGITDPGDALFLGLNSGTPLFAIEADQADEPDRGRFEEVRALAIQGTLPAHELARAGLARALVEWHRHHRFCANCGSATKVVEGGAKRACEACGREHFPRVDPVAIMLIHTEERCLLGRSAHFLPNMYSTLAGFMEPGESIAETVRREVKEEAGIEVGAVRFHSDQPWPFPSSLMIGCIGEALSEEIVIDPVELEDARWFSREELQAMMRRDHPDGLIVPFPMAIAHHLIKAFVDREHKSR